MNTFIEECVSNAWDKAKMNEGITVCGATLFPEHHCYSLFLLYLFLLNCESNVKIIIVSKIEV